jgi:hypothetical protein
MRIVLATHWLSSFTGSETWTYTMAKYLSRKHNVYVKGNILGKMANRVRMLGVKVGEEWKDGDFAIVNHNTNQDCPIPMIFTSHSKFAEIEQFPNKPCIKVAPSEEHAQGRTKNIIGQPIDLERFKYVGCRARPKRVLYLSNPGYSKGLGIVKKAFHDLEVDHLDEEMFDIENKIKEADVVVSLGRGCYEALAMGKNVINGDFRNWSIAFQGAGMVTEDSFDELLKTNLSGRGNQITFTPSKLREELDKYNSSRNINMSQFEAQLIADKYVSLWTDFKRDI